MKHLFAEGLLGLYKVRINCQSVVSAGSGLNPSSATCCVYYLGL